MDRLNKMIGRYWWCLAYSLDECRLARFTFTHKEIHLADSFAGTLEACRQYMTLHQGEMDGLLVADDSLPVRLLPGTEFAMQCADTTAPFLPGISMSDLRVIPGLSPEEPVAFCQDKASESLLDTLVSNGFCISRVVPMAVLYAGMAIVHTETPVEALVRKTPGSSDIWLFHAGEFKGYHRIAGGKESLQVFFQQFLPHRFPGAEAPVIQELTVGCATGIPVELAPLAFLAQETEALDLGNAPSLGARNDEIANQRREDAKFLRRVLRLSTWVLGFAMVSLCLLGLLAAGYGLYTRADRTEYEKRRELDKELLAMSQNLERKREAMAELLRHRTRRTSKMTALVQSLPQGLWLTRWDAQGGRHTIQGLALNGDDISQLLALLEKSPHFRQIRLRTTERTTWQGRPVVRFDMGAEEQE